jgi:hypothetical protein
MTRVKAIITISINLYRVFVPLSDDDDDLYMDVLKILKKTNKTIIDINAII